jgi:hypothetical protein
MTKALKFFIDENLDKKKYLRVNRENKEIEKFFSKHIDFEEYELYLLVNTLSNIEDIDYYELLEISNYDDLLIDSYILYMDEEILESDLFLVKLITKVGVPILKKEYKKLKNNYERIDPNEFTDKKIKKTLKKIKESII